MVWLHVYTILALMTRGSALLDPFCDNTCPEFQDHFATLGVADNTTLKQIKKACRNEIKLVHPDKQVGKSEEERRKMNIRHLAVSEACQGLGTHKRHDEVGDETLSGSEVFDEYVALLKLCRVCAKDRGGHGGDGWDPMGGLGGLGSMAYEMAFGPGTSARVEYFDRRGRRVAGPNEEAAAGWGGARKGGAGGGDRSSGDRGGDRRGGEPETRPSQPRYRLGEQFMKREIVCKANVFEEVCSALDYERVGGSSLWVPSSFGWYDYIPPPKQKEEEGEKEEEEAGGEAAEVEPMPTMIFDPLLGSEEFLPNGGTVTSRDGSHFLIMMWDGNLAIYEGSGPQNAGRWPVWQSNTFTSHPESFAILQRDGNLVVKEGRGPDDPNGGVVLWSSNRRALDVRNSGGGVSGGGGGGIRSGGGGGGGGAFSDAWTKQQLWSSGGGRTRGGSSGGGSGSSGGDPAAAEFRERHQPRVYAKLEDDGNLAVYGAWAEDGYSESECVWASIGCPDTLALASNVRKVKNKLRLAYRRVLEGVSSGPYGGGGRNDGSGGGGPRGSMRTNNPLSQLARGVASLSSWLKRMSSRQKHAPLDPEL